MASEHWISHATGFKFQNVGILQYQVELAKGFWSRVIEMAYVTSQGDSSHWKVRE